MLMNGKNLYFYNAHTIQSNIESYTVPIQNPMAFFTEIEKVLKFIWNHRFQKANEILRKKTKPGDFTIPYFKSRKMVQMNVFPRQR